MENTWFDWLLGLPFVFAGFGDWLISPLPYLNIAPLWLFSVAGIVAIIGYKVFRLVVGG